MIVPMEKVTVLCLAADRDRTLHVLRDLGVLHVSHSVAPEGADIEEARGRLGRIERALELLPHGKVATPADTDPATVVDAIEVEVRRSNEISGELRELRALHDRYEPFGSFDPKEAECLARHSLPVQLFRAPAGHPLPRVKDAPLLVLRRDRSGLYFAVVGMVLVEDPAVEHVPLPPRPLRELDEEIARLDQELQACDMRIAGHADSLPRVEALAEEVRAEIRFLEARSGMGARRPVVFLRGFCPQRKVERIRALAAEHGWGLLVEPLRPGETVPTQLENAGWVRPVKAVFDFIGVLPGYWEVDISAFFLIFLTLFFAMIVGDGGYGALFLVFTLLGRALAPGVMKKPLYPLLLIMSLATIGWGLLTGNFFGIAVEGLPAPLRASRDWLSPEANMMQLCFFIGAVHLTIAHGWGMLRNRGNLTVLSHLGWILSTWFMYAMANLMVLNQTMPGYMKVLFIIGVVLIALFMTPLTAMKTEWMGHAMLPLTIINNFVDVVSYVRLFAVGTATLAVASAFNEMAAGFGWSGLGSSAAAALILFFGHTLNILLAAMGVLVHGVRLNTLEFSGHLGLTWSGVPYEPLARKGGSTS